MAVRADPEQAAPDQQQQQETKRQHAAETEEEQQQQQQAQAEEIAEEPTATAETSSTEHPLSLPAAAPSSYSSLRGRHLLYRWPALHASLVELLLHLCLDPSSAACQGLNELYCQRFPLQASAELHRLADAQQLQRAAAEANAAKARAAGIMESSSGALGASSDDAVATTPSSNVLLPLQVNVLFALHMHVNHPANRYLCSMILPPPRDDSAAAAAAAVAAGVVGGSAAVRPLSSSSSSSPSCLFRSRERSLRRLMKLLFEQLFDARVYTHRTQIGRGRSACVYSATHTALPETKAADAPATATASTSASATAAATPTRPRRVALKQVEQASSIHEQMCIVDLFTEISIMELLTSPSSSDQGHEQRARAQARAHAPCVEVLDFGVGEGCFWIVMPLAQQSLKAFKIHEAEADQEEAEEEAAQAKASSNSSKKNKKNKKQKDATADAEAKAKKRVHRLQQSDRLMQSLLVPLLCDSSLAAVSPVLRGLAARSPARRLLASLALYAQILEVCEAVQRNNIVHFDIKADNFLLLRPDAAREGDGEEGDGDDGAEVRVALADFGEALLIPSCDWMLLSCWDPCGGGGGGGGGAGADGVLSHAASGGGGGGGTGGGPGAAAGGSRISRGTENIQSPEMLSLVRALDRSDVRFDRRRKVEPDFASDVWSVGCAFYEVVMHVYGSSDGDHGEDDGEDDGDEAAGGGGGGGGGTGVGMGGSGLLFEESGGLPIFLQVTCDSLGLLSSSKRGALSRPRRLGPALLAPLENFLTFVLRRQRTQRPPLNQVRIKFHSTVIEVLSIIVSKEQAAAAAAAAADGEQVKLERRRVGTNPIPIAVAAPSSSSSSSSSSSRPLLPLPTGTATAPSDQLAIATSAPASPALSEQAALRSLFARKAQS